MLLVSLVRFLRWLGWLAFAASVGVVIVVTLRQAVGGPAADQAVWPTARLWRYFATSLAMSAGATVLALCLALPATLALLTARRAWQRSVLLGLTVLPMVTMPSTFAYAWMLLSTSRLHWAAAVMNAVGWNTPGWQPAQTAWVLATWLWPIPCLVLVAAFRHAGRGAYQLACLDASAVRAFLRSALPVMRAPLVAALAGVFILCLTDNTVPGLMSATGVWAVEMLAQAAVAPSYNRPVAYLLWQSWPMLAVIAALALAARPGLRQMSSWADEPDAGDTGTLLTSSPLVWWLAAGLAAATTVLPIIVFCVELANGRTTPTHTLAVVYRTLSAPALATLLVAVLAGVFSVLVAVALLDEPQEPVTRRLRTRNHSLFAIRYSSLAANIAAGLMLVAALLPPELSGTALASFFAGISNPRQWNVYDNTPWTWVAAMIVRFGILTVFIARLMNRRIPRDVILAATADGATPLQRLVHARLPVLWGSLLTAGIMVAALTMSEVSVSVLVQPPRFFGGSLAVAIDSQMHYGRNMETIAAALLLATPAFLIAGAVPLLTRSGRRPTC